MHNIKPNDLIIVRTSDDDMFIVKVTNCYDTPEKCVIEGKYKTIIDIDERPEKWDADGCVGVFDDFTLIQRLN